MKINHNIAAIKSNTKLSRTNTKMQNSIEALSSGYRINKAADDAAGMAISQKMKTQIRGLEQASRNASDGISVLQTAEGAMTEIENMLQRMRELSVQAANETNTSEDREAIQDEINQLNQEIDRISNDTEFNTKKLINGDADRQIYTSVEGVEMVSVSDPVASKDYKFTVAEIGKKANITGSATGEETLSGSGTFSINGELINLSDGMTLQEVYIAVRELGTLVDVDVFSGTADELGNRTTDRVELGMTFAFEQQKAGAGRNIVLSGDENVMNFLGLGDLSAEELKSVGTNAKIDLDVEEDSETAFKATATYVADGNRVMIHDNNGFEMVFNVDEEVEADSEVTARILDAGPVTLQIGANAYQEIVVNIPKLDTETLQTKDINVRSTDGAGDALEKLDYAINKVSSARAKLGAYENRLDHCINNLESSDENITGALSRIEDLDMAKEMSNYTQLSVLQQAGTSMLAQANQMPQTILNLLQG